jgi:type IV pilus assembly protein PilO
MKKVQALASQSNLSVKNFTPGATVNKEFYQEWPINVGLEGNFHNLGLFFDRVSRLSRLVNAGNLKVKVRTKQTSSQTITATCVATTFVYVDAPAAPPPGAKGAQPARPGAKK